MKKIDAHQHFWTYDEETHDWIGEDMQDLRQDFMPQDLKSEMDKVDVEGSVAIQTEQSEKETDFLLKLEAKHSFIKGVVGWLDIQAEDFGQKLEQYAPNPALKGLCHIVQDEDNQFLFQKDFMDGIDLLKKYDLTYDILIYQEQLPAIVEFARQFPEQRFVLDHIAKPDIKNGQVEEWEKGIRALAEHPNMYCKLSGLVTEADWDQWQPSDFRPYLKIVFDAFESDRLMFGSDWPVCTVAASYPEVVSVVQDYLASLSQREQAMVMGENACRFYDLDID